jgi:hypothetical protein
LFRGSHCLSGRVFHTLLIFFEMLETLLQQNVFAVSLILIQLKFVRERSLYQLEINFEFQIFLKSSDKKDIVPYRSLLHGMFPHLAL